MADPLQTLPPTNYTDPSVFDRVREQIYFRTWQFACHASQIPSRGDYVSLSLFDQDLFVIRDSEGEIRGFYNVCQHRGHGLVSGNGHARLLVCPYHAWSYDIDGRLKAAPGIRNVPGFDVSRICLTPVRVDTLCDFIFVNLDSDAPHISECFPGVEAAVRNHCPEIHDRAFAHEFSATEACNWLVAVENYNECYHCKVVHKTFASGVIDPKTYNVSVFDSTRCLHHSAKAQQGSGAWYDTSGSDYASFFLWPAFSLQIYPSGVVNTYHWRPLSVTSTAIYRQFYSPDAKVSTELQKIIDLDRDTTFAEDLDLVNSVQRGMGSKGYKGGPLVVNPDEGVNSEHSVAALHHWFREGIS